MNNCLNCGGSLKVEKYRCQSCQLSVEGTFETPRLARLSAEHQVLAERILLTGGNLKQVAVELEVSYPTLRKRVDGLIAELGHLVEADDKRADALLADVEAGRLTPEAAARQIREMNGDL